MSVPGVQTALAVAPPSAVQISPSVAVLDGPDGGMVLVNGFAAYCWDRGDDVLRRFAAVGASMLPDVTDVAVAAAFSTSTVSLWRWRRSAQTDGPAALVRRRPGPRGPSKLTPALRTEVDALRARGASIAVIAERLGVSTFTVRVALGRVPGRVMPGGTGAGAADSAGGDADAGDPAGADADADGGIGTAAEARSGGGTGGLTDIDVGNDRGDDPDAGDAPAGLECEIGAADPVDAGAGVPTGADADADGDAGAVAEAGSEGGTADLADDDGDTDGGTAPDAGDVPAGVAEIEVATAGLVGHAAVLPVLPDPVDRSIERASARWGLLPYAPPVFAPAARVPLAGLFLAVPALAATGLLEGARQVYGGVPHGFYGLDAMLCEAVFRTMLGQPRAEGATRVNPTDLGRVLGLDRAPEVKTVRRKMALLAARGKAAQLLTVQARRHVADHEEATSVLYVDGHVRTYHGKRKIQKTHVSRLRFPAPATVETWIADAQGAPVWVVMAEPGASLASEIRRLLPQIRGIVGDDRRVLVGFDRGGWSPALFAEMIAAGFDVLTWRKGPTPDVDAELFAEHTHTDEHGVEHTWTLADTMVRLPLEDTDPDAGTVTLRQVSKLDPGTGRQVHILTSRTDLPSGQVCFRMGARWREENYFRYGRMHFALDSHDSYTVADDDPDRSVPNPAKKKAHQAVQAERARLARAETRRDEQLLELRSPAPGTAATITNQMHDVITAPVRAARVELDAAVAAHRAIPTRLPLGQVRPGQQILDTETKLLTHAIRMAAFNTQTTLARTITTSTGYRKAANEAHALVRTALAGTGDIAPTAGKLHIRLDPLHTPRATAALAELCTTLNDTATVFPGTDLQLHYSVKPHR
jgi:hypothetical protein